MNPLLSAAIDTGIWLIILTPVIGLLGRDFWVLDLANHFRIQMGLVITALAAVLVCAGRPIEAAAAALSAGYCWGSVYRRVRPKKILSGAGIPTASIFTCNVLMTNRGHAALAALIHQKDPDVVVLLETDHHWHGAMREALSQHHHHKAEPLSNFHGLAVYSKVPIEAAVLQLHPGGTHSIRCVVRHPAGDFVLWCLHPKPPMGLRVSMIHQKELEELARRVKDEPLPVVITGDLNAAPWSRAFWTVLRHFEDSANGFGLQTTWPAHLPALFRIPIDHFLHSDRIETVSHEVLPNIGSDHRPIQVRLAIRG